MKKFRIIKYLTGIKTDIYAVCVDDSRDTEFDKFLDEYSEDYEKEINWLLDTIDKIKDNYGIRNEYFEDQGTESIYRFINRKDDLAKVRLYCIKWGSEIIILGGAAIKDFSIISNSWQDHPECKNIIAPLAKIDKYLYDNKIIIKEAAEKETTFEIE